MMQEKKISAKKDAGTRVGKRLLGVLDKLLSGGGWESSLFLSSTYKKIQKLRDETYQILQEEVPDEAQLEAQQDKFKRPIKEGFLRLYILLYQTEGGKLLNWQYALRTLLEYSVSRPTYNDANYVKELIRTKPNIERYGYAIIDVAKSDLYAQEQPVKDALNHEMIVLKEGAIKRENIIGFVHANRKQYSFIDGELVLQGEI
jgi:hypothetical protein